MLEGLGQVLLAERQLADSPDLGVLTQSVFHWVTSNRGEPTGFRFFLISLSSVPALMAMISGAASGSCAMGEPHSEQKRRWTALPEEPVPDHVLMGPLMVSFSFGTTATRAVEC